MNSYQHMAALYDILMDEVDYEAWALYITDIFQKYGLTPEWVLDAACGTASLTIPLAQKGYRMWGLDISADMLSVAEQKARASKLKINFLNQDMTRLRLNERFDAVICMCDGVNYITEEADLKKFFKSVFEVLKEKGIFIFDISSYNKLRYTLGNNLFYEEKNNIHYIWNNSFDESSETVEMSLVFFTPHGQFYEKFEEYHVQKAYVIHYLKDILADTGFSGIKAFEAFGFDDPDEDSERVFFVALKECV